MVYQYTMLLSGLILAIVQIANAVAAVPFLERGPKIFVKAQIDGRGLYRCLVDTAFSRSAFDVSLYKDGNVPHSVRIGRLSYDVADPLKMSLAGAEPGPRLSCVIGVELFRKYVITIDYLSRVLIADDPAVFRYDRPGHVVPLRLKHNKVVVPVRLTAGGSSVTHWERLDTESEETVADDFVDRSEVRRQSSLNNGHHSGRYTLVAIGPYAFSYVWAPSASEHTIGSEILRRFVVTIDVPHSRMYLEPNLHLHDPIPTPPPAW